MGMTRDDSEIEAFVRAEWGDAGSDDGRIPIANPADGSELFAAPVATPAEVDAAVAAARAVAAGWARTPAADRAAAVGRAADAVAARAADLARLTTVEMGKPIGDARGGVDAGVGTLRQYAELGPLHRGPHHGRAPARGCPGPPARRRPGRVPPGQGRGGPGRTRGLDRHRPGH